MNKSELIDAIAADAGISKEAAKKALNSFTENVTKALASGDKVALVGFGTFSTSERAARTGINPQTKKEIQIAAKTVAKFKAGSELSDAVDTKKKK
jgi:DNA-binding protein HU-beta